MRKRGLGRGLSDLISSDSMSQSRSVVEVPLEEIEPNVLQPREHMDETALEELTSSIETHGVLQPIMVRQTAAGYQIVAGERRWRAAQRAGLRTIPCLIQDADDLMSLEIALIENLQRDDLDALEAARGYRMLISDYGLTQEDVAQKVGKSRSAVANTLRILDLPSAVQDHMREGRISEGHGRALLPLMGQPDVLLSALEQVIEQNLTVRDTERLVKTILNPQDFDGEGEGETPIIKPSKPVPRQDFARDPHIAAAEQRLRASLAAKVSIRPAAKRGGIIHVRYYDTADLERLLDIFEHPPSE
jgi:ParB family transcriptional regulator, chromosome partitioning protein